MLKLSHTVGIAQRLEHWAVAPGVVGSNPTTHPILTLVSRRFIHKSEIDAGWSSPVARRAHNPKVAGSNPAPATKI